MKMRLLLLFIVAVICFVLAGCTDFSEPPNTPEAGNNSTENLPDNTEQKEITNMYITINGNKMKVTLADNTAVDALVEILKQGDIVYEANDYGDFEKVGYLGHNLPASDESITTQAGDVILYSGNQVVLFYGSNTWAYTRLGRIDGYSVSELRSLLGAGSGKITVTISLN